MTFRVLQGAGGGMLAPVGMAMLYRVFPPEERVRAAAILTVPTTLAPALGPVLGGLLTTDLSWRWVFYVNLPIGAAAFVFGAAFVRESRQPHPGRFDLPGFLLSGFGLGLLMYGVSEGPVKGWHRADVLATIAAGAVLLAAAVVVELRTAEPMVDLRLLGNRLFRSSNGVMVLGSVAFLGTLYAISLYYQDGRGLSALASGLSTFPEAIGVMGGAQLATRWLYPTFGPRRHITGGAIGVAVLTTAIVAVGPVHIVSGHPVANLTAYRIAFAVAATVALIGTACSLTIRDADAAQTIPERKSRRPGIDQLARRLQKGLTGQAARASPGVNPIMGPLLGLQHQ